MENHIAPSPSPFRLSHRQKGERRCAAKTAGARPLHSCISAKTASVTLKSNKRSTKGVSIMSRKNSRARLERIARRKMRRLANRWQDKDHVKYNLHHRKAKSLGGRGGENLAMVSKKAHQAFNIWAGKGNPTAEEVVDALNTLWVDPAFVVKFTAVPKGAEPWPTPAAPAPAVSTSPLPSSVLSVRRSTTYSNGHVRVSYSPRPAFVSNYSRHSIP